LTYYKKGSVIPKMYSDNLGNYYDFNDEGLLYDLSNGNLIVKNSKMVGKSNDLKINGQLVWQHSCNTRASQLTINQIGKIKKHLVGYFNNYFYKQSNLITSIRSLPKPLAVDFIYHTNIESDFDNFKLFYEKSFLDAIQRKIWINGNYVQNVSWLIGEDNTKNVVEINNKIIKSNENKLIINLRSA
jgi:hypothetical protein